MRRLLLLIFLSVICIPMSRSAPLAGAQIASVSRLIVRAVPIDPKRRERRRIGNLVYLGGWELRSPDERFGGLSAMVPVPGGFLALSDGGTLMHLSLAFKSPTLHLRALPGGPGASPSKANRDTEAMTLDPAGRAWATFEQHNEIWRYAPGFARAEARAAPAAMRRWRANKGAEAMLRLPDGRFLVWAEARRPDGSAELLLFDSDPALPETRSTSLGYRAPRGYSITDAALVGAALVGAAHAVTLHRRISLTDGLSAKIGIVDLAGLAEGRLLAPRIIATLAPPMTVDNMEAIAVTREAGSTILWIASDDNFSALQRTLLLKFRLDL